MAWLVVAALLALYVAYDATRRESPRAGQWVALTLIGGALVMPFYLAGRRLRPGEIRSGGFGWNVCRYFALTWSLFVGAGFFAGCLAWSETYNGSTGAAIGTVIGAGFWFGIWFMGTAVALLLGLMLRNSAVVERGEEPAPY